MNTFGHLFRLTSFGESHGPAMGGVIDGMPAGLDIDLDLMQQFVDARRPVDYIGGSNRRESDQVELLSGIFEGKTLGTPIGFIIRNHDMREKDYESLRSIYRPSHADYTYQMKYGHRDHRGGGRASARETLTRVVAGALAMQALSKLGVRIQAFVEWIGCKGEYLHPENITLPHRVQNRLHVFSDTVAHDMEQEIANTIESGDTLGGSMLCIAQGVPSGWGEPVAAKLHADLGAAMLSINAVKAFEMGGHDIAFKHGSEVQDTMMPDEHGGVHFAANHSGGVQGGISNGNDLFFRVAFKAVPTLMRETASVNALGQEVVYHPGGRHDVVVVHRAVPIVEAMTAMVLLDHYLLSKTNRII